MLYIKGKSKDDYKWEIARIVQVTGEERLKYPIPNREEEYYTSRLDVENATIFDKDNFKDALDTLYKIVKETIDEN
jgi:hypothetical protein